MNESQPINFSGLIRELSEKANAGIRPQEMQKSAAEKTVFPPIAEEAQVDLYTYSGKLIRDFDTSYHISADVPLPQEEKDSFFQWTLEQGKDLQPPKWHYVVSLGQSWTREDFQAETRLPSFLRSRNRIISHATTINREGLRMFGKNKREHSAWIELYRNELTIKANGGYGRNLKILAQDLDCQSAIVSLSREDAESIRDSDPDGLYADAIREQLHPRSYINLRPGVVLVSVSPVGTPDFIQLRLQTEHVSGFEEKLSKNLFRPSDDQGSQVIGVEKTYGLIDILQNKRLGDMKKIMGILANSGFSQFGNYEISRAEAKTLLDKEVQLLTEIYSSDDDYLSAGVRAGDAVRKLAVELLGKDTILPLERPLDQQPYGEEYVDFLVSKGYKKGQFTSDVMLFYANNERHLLEFYKQVYQRNPANAVELYRGDYRNSVPVISIHAEQNVDGSKINKLGVAPKATVFLFNISPNLPYNQYDNKFSVEKRSGDIVSFRSATSLNNSELLPFQEKVFDKLGITFR